MELQGTVVRWRDGIAQVQIALSACSACTHDCSARFGGSGRYLLAEAPSPLQPGQTVLVDVSLPSPARAVALAYLLPLAGFMAGLFAGNAAFGGAPLPALGAALAGGALAYGAVAVLERGRRARIVSVGGAGAGCPHSIQEPIGDPS